MALNAYRFGTDTIPERLMRLQQAHKRVRAERDRYKSAAETLARLTPSRGLPCLTGWTFIDFVQAMAVQLNVPTPSADEADFLLWERSAFPVAAPDYWVPQVAVALVEAKP